jgi:uncharacterized membrane protein YecN with MAPEG domain
MATRVKNNHYIGDRLPTVSPSSLHTQKQSNNPQPTTQATSLSVDSTPDRDPLEIASRCHANFIENVPLAFIFLTICELNGGNRKYLNYVMGLLFALRVAHADGGLRLKGRFGTCGVGRPMGYYGSCGVIGGLAGYAGWLVKGYWGI